MKMKLEEMVFPQLTSEEKAFTAGYMAAEKLWEEMVRKGMNDVEEFVTFVAYDYYMDAMTNYFKK